MKRMELQSFPLKLSELKEYDQAKQERKEGGNKEDSSEMPPRAEPITKGPKTKQEINARIMGLNMNMNS
jgi:hypothetical protein